MTVLSLTAVAVAALVAAGPTAGPEPAAAAAPDVAADAARRAAGPDTPLGRAVRAGCLARARVSLHAAFVGGAAIASLEPDRPMTPASTQKLLTSAAALQGLGPAHRFFTRFLSNGKLDAEGVLHGDLVVRGGGAPDLTASELWVAVRELRVLGLRGITGDLVGDDSYLETPGRPPGWAGPENDNPYNAPPGALVVNWNAVRVEVRPGPELGAPGRVSVFPLEGVARVDVQVGTGTRQAVAISRGVAEDGNVIRVRGSVSRLARPAVRWVGLEDPTGTFLLALRETLEDQDIVVEGTLRRGATPPDASELYAHPSRPVSELVRLMNKHSNNVMAEILLRDLGASAKGEPGTAEAGLGAVQDLLDRWDVPSAGTRMVDGSGLSRENRTTARALVGLLTAAALDPGVGPELMASLPLPGEDGTMKDREVGGPVGSLRVKTGSLNGVNGLAGYVAADHGRWAAFAFLAEDDGQCPGGAARAGLDTALGELGALLAGTEAD